MQEGLEIFDQIHDALTGVLGQTDRRLQRADDALLEQTETEVLTLQRLRETNERLAKALEMLRELRAATEKVMHDTDAEMLRIESALAQQVAAAGTLGSESAFSDQASQER
jgi:Mg2+ and Co2+ transporter CorA